MIKIINYIVLVLALIFLAYIDYKKRIIPNKILIAMLISRLMLMLIEMFLYRGYIYSIILSPFIGLVAGGGVFLLVALILKNSIGMGDIKLVAIIGFYIGIENLFSCIICSLFISLLCGLVLILAKKINNKDMLPFAPFLLFGTILSIVLRL